jgi:cysteine-rich repeat protein
MKHTYKVIESVASLTGAFVLTFSMGNVLGNSLVDGADKAGMPLTAYLSETMTNRDITVRENPVVRVKKKVRRMKGIIRSKITRPSARLANSGSTIHNAAASSSSVKAAIKASCGDSLILADLGEECDDGNAVAGDGCSATCKLEAGFTCGGKPTVCFTKCGDGTVTPVEKCDDGNEAGGDGCSAVCKTEFGYKCTGTPSKCEPTPYCGDGVKASTEECDDGNTSNTDSCTTLCKNA